MKENKTLRQRTVWVQNEFHINVKKCCASCAMKEILKDGTRVCSQMQLKVESTFKCQKWEMSEGLRNAGRSGGVVKLHKTNQVVIG